MNLQRAQRIIAREEARERVWEPDEGGWEERRKGTGDVSIAHAGAILSIGRGHRVPLG